MKKALIIAHDFPPLNSIGAQRPYSWYKYFQENNIYPVIIARNSKVTNEEDIHDISKSDEIYLIDCENHLREQVGKIPLIGRFLRKTLTFLEYLLKWKTLKFDFTKHLYISARNHLKNNQFDVIIATGEPWILFKYARNLSDEFNIPWIADYRDGWNTNVKLEYSYFSRFLSKFYFLNLEKKTINSATLLSFSDPCEAIKMNKITTMKKIIIPLNGYDNELISGLSESHAPNDILTISYAGTIYDFQDLESFLIGLDNFIKKSGFTKVRVNLFGSKNNQTTINRIKEVNKDLFEYIHLTAKIPQEEVLNHLNNSHVLLLLSSNKHVALPAKIFEYIGLERLILVSTNDHSDVERFVNETNSGIICIDSDDVYNSLVTIYDKFKNDSNFKVSIPEKENYSRKHQAKVFCDEIKKII